MHAKCCALPCTALDVIVETVANGDKVTLVNFGTFDSKKREAREGRNPQTNKPMHIPGTRWPGGTVLGCRREGTATHACAHTPLRSFDGADVQVRQNVQGDGERCEGARLIYGTPLRRIVVSRVRDSAHIWLLALIASRVQHCFGVS